MNSFVTQRVYGQRTSLQPGNSLAASSPLLAIWITTASLLGLADRARITAWPNIAPGHTETLLTQWTLDDYALYVGGELALFTTGGMPVESKRLDFDTPVAVPGFLADDPARPAGASYFAVCDLSRLVFFGYQTLAGDDLNDAIRVTNFTSGGPWQTTVSVSDSVVNSAVGFTMPQADAPTKALLEYRLTWNGTAYTQKLFLNGTLKATVAPSLPLSPPLARNFVSVAKNWEGSLYELRVYAQQMTDAAYLAVRSELAALYRLTCGTDL